MKIRAITFGSLICLLLLSNIVSVNAQCGKDGKGSTELWKVMQELNPSFHNYFWTAYPTEIWGIGSILTDDAKGDCKFKNPNLQVMPGWRFFGQTKKPIMPDDLINLGVDGDYVYINEGPPINSADRKDVSNKALKAALPLVGNLLGISGDITSLRDTNLKLDSAKLKIRQINKIAVKAYIQRIESKSKTNPNSLSPYETKIVELISKRKLYIITDDVVMYGMNVTVQFKTDSTKALDVKFQKKLEEYVGKDANASFKVVNNGAGNYTLKIAEPFVFARYGSNYKDW